MSEQQNPRKFSRREMLRLAATAGVGMLATACTGGLAPAGQTQVVEKVVKETVVVEREVSGGKKVVRIMLASWAAAEVPFDQMAREFGEIRDDVEVKIDTAVDTAKLMAQISSGDVEWSGFGIITPFLNIVSHVESGLIQPMEDLIQSSSQEGADTLMSDMIETVKEDASYEGHLYAIPYSFENITFNWRNDQFAEIGVTETPATWDDWYEAAVELKKWGADQEIIPTSFVGSLWTDAGALITSAMEQPYTTEGMIDWTAPEAIAALEFYRKLVSEELTPVHGFDGWFESFQRGKVASVQAQSSRGVWGQKIHGEANMTTSPIATMEKGSGSGTVYWGNGLGVVSGAPYAQEVADFYVHALGPANTNFQKAVIQSGKTPVYNSAYDNIIESDPLFSTFRWMNGMREDVARSLPVPRNTFYLIQHQVYTKYIVEYIEDPSMSPEMLADLIVEDSLAEIEKQKIQ